MPPELARVAFVLVETSHPGNIGAAARAMKNMGLSELRLVRPKQFPHADATARASGADDLLAGARVFPQLEEAIADCCWVVGASARRRSLPLPMLDPRELAHRASQEMVTGETEGRRIAILFGRERTGLRNDEMDRCHALVQIPVDDAYPSLNIAAAVQVIAYELRLAMLAAERAPGPSVVPDAVDAGEMERFYEHLEQVLKEIGFLDPGNPRQLMRRLRRLFQRARPDQNEINILRGMLSAVQKSRRR
ncbi:MAG TPA: RNA methyltransferase [Gammaproteobacteria bacterium]|nr:RNA methyltransferase [Gammaproteobacteria bacterium]